VREAIGCSVELSIRESSFVPSQNHAKKKSLFADEQNSDRVVEDTKRFIEEIAKVPAEKLVFGDQMGCNRAMTPKFARAERGKRAVDSVPGNRGKNLSVMGFMGIAGLLSVGIIEGAFNADLVYDYFKNHVLEDLEPGQVVILDNARIHHKRESDLRELLATKGCRLLFLPPYSPQWNPIENAWGKMKQIIASLKARTKDVLIQAIRRAAACVTTNDAQGWFEHCGHV
jgi:transposase